jgi:hypothetical protein
VHGCNTCPARWLAVTDSGDHPTSNTCDDNLFDGHMGAALCFDLDGSIAPPVCRDRR